MEDLRQRISEAVDLLLFDEAAKCLEAQAYRAAYIMTWICIAESLRNKFVVMSQRDATVGRIVGQIEQAKQQDRPTDKLLLENAAQIGLITAEELKKLEYIREMRNIYAHPTGADPSKQEVLAALVIAVETVLSRPPLLRHGYVASLLRSLFEDRHFLDDVPATVREYATGVAHRVHPEVLPYLLKGLTERLEQTIIDPELRVFQRRGLEFGATLLAEMRPDLSAEAWNILAIVQKYPAASSLLLSTPEVWPLLPEQCQDMVLGHLVEPVRGSQVQPPTGPGLQRARALYWAGSLTTRQQERFCSSFERAPYVILKEAGVPLQEYAKRVIMGLSSHDWYMQNPASDALRDAGANECSRVDKDIQEQLGRNILQAAEGKARSAESFIRSIIGNKEVWPSAFVEGLILGCCMSKPGK